MKRIDKIRQMSSEELARCLSAIGGCYFNSDCEGCFLYGADICYEPDKLAKWLEEEVQEDA